MKLICGLLVLALVHLTISGTLVGPSQTVYTGAGNAPVPRGRPFSRNEIANEVDADIRATYWYYLPNAFLTYVAHIDSERGCLYLHLYKNYIGTFLAITNYVDLSNTVTINTFVRVGEGCDSLDRISEPIIPSSFVISLDLGDGEYFVPHEPTSKSFNFSEGWARQKWFRDQQEAQRIHQNCLQVEKFIKSEYWYYLTPDTKTLDFSESNPGTGCYCSFTFLNYLGLFQVIGQWNGHTNQAQVSTFVRLGDGSNPNEVTKCKIFPSVS
jgi:hypothetical protein